MEGKYPELLELREMGEGRRSWSPCPLEVSASLVSEIPEFCQLRECCALVLFGEVGHLRTVGDGCSQSFTSPEHTATTSVAPVSATRPKA